MKFYNPKKTDGNKYRNESGMSLVLALGVTALLVGLCLTYLATTQTETKATFNFNNLKVSKMLAESGLRRCIASLKAYSSVNNYDLGSICSHKILIDGAADSQPYYFDLEEKLNTSVDGITYYEVPSGYNPADVDAVTWIYIEKGNGIDSEIIGRIAYAVVPDKGRIDPSAVVDSGMNAFSFGVAAASEDKNENFSMIDSSGNEVKGRPGRDVNEISLSSLEKFGAWFSNGDARDMSVDNASPVGCLPKGTRWTDFATIFAELGVSESDEEYYRDNFSLHSPKDAEAFWVDMSGNSFREPTEFFHRFNLRRSDWDSVTADSIVYSSVSPFSISYPDHDINAIPWIKNWKHPGTDTFSDTMSKQIAANLIDYSDKNNIASTDDEDSPSYVGLEKVPYINEVNLAFKGSITKTSVAAEFDYNCEIFLDSFAVELVNMYDNTGTIDTTAQISYDIEFVRTPWIDASTIEDTGHTASVNITIDPEEYEYATNSSVGSSPIYSNTFRTGDLSMSIDDFKINNLKVKLTDAVTGEFYDYSYMPVTNLTPVTMSSNGTEGTIYFNAQINDPRQNLYEIDWNELDWGTNNSSETLGAANSAVLNPTPADGDPEPGVTLPWDVSTAYIRNDRMLSPWELGIIHRAAPWQTINLKTFNSSEGIRLTSGGNLYSEGDANILDQIKMTSEREVYGKINLNTDIEAVLQVLFHKINIGSDVSSSDGPGDPGSGTEIGVSEADALTTLILNINGVNGGSVLGTRAQIVRSIDGVSLDYGQTDDLHKEELIGKFINLTKATQPDIYTVVAVGEAIKDLGGATIMNNGTPIDTEKNRFDIGADDILSSYKVMAVIQLDSSTNEITFLRYRILTD